MTLLSIGGKKMNLGKTKVLIEDISIGGLCFSSTLKLPIRNDIILQFQTEILYEKIKLVGQIVRREETIEEISEYGVKFLIDEVEQMALAKVLNNFQALLEKRPKQAHYRMVMTENRHQYFQQLMINEG